MSTEDVFEPSWERDREEFFAKVDYAKVTTPAYVIHEGALEENLKILASVKKGNRLHDPPGTQRLRRVEDISSREEVLGRRLCQFRE
jgi:hypothetical protein